MKTEDLLVLAIPVLYFFMAVVEKIWPARAYPALPKWHLVGIGFFLLTSAISVVLPLFLPLDWVAAHRLLDGTKLGIAGGAVVGWIAITFAWYWTHRFLHRSNAAWRWTHQMHHAPKRIDIPSSMVFHPFDLLVQNVVVLGTSVFVLGLDPMASAILGTWMAFIALFQHWNVKTPQVLGYVLQRPEQHNVHHATNVHGFNYGDLAIWDMCFGTFRNPERFEGAVGFEEPASFGKMFLGVDVHATGTPNGEQDDFVGVSSAAE